MLRYVTKWYTCKHKSYQSYGIYTDTPSASGPTQAYFLQSPVRSLISAYLLFKLISTYLLCQVLSQHISYLGMSPLISFNNSYLCRAPIQTYILLPPLSGPTQTHVLCSDLHKYIFYTAWNPEQLHVLHQDLCRRMFSIKSYVDL